MNAERLLLWELKNLLNLIKKIIKKITNKKKLNWCSVTNNVRTSTDSMILVWIRTRELYEKTLIQFLNLDKVQLSLLLVHISLFSKKQFTKSIALTDFNMRIQLGDIILSRLNIVFFKICVGNHLIPGNSLFFKNWVVGTIFPGDISIDLDCFAYQGNQLTPYPVEWVVVEWHVSLLNPFLLSIQGIYLLKKSLKCRQCHHNTHLGRQSNVLE